MWPLSKSLTGRHKMETLNANYPEAYLWTFYFRNFIKVSLLPERKLEFENQSLRTWYWINLTLCLTQIDFIILGTRSNSLDIAFLWMFGTYSFTIIISQYAVLSKWYMLTLYKQMVQMCLNFSFNAMIRKLTKWIFRSPGS